MTFSAAAHLLDASLSATVNVDAPKLDVNISQVHNVDSTCDPAPQSLPPDQVYQNLTLVAPSWGLELSEVFNETGKFFKSVAEVQSFSQTIYDHGLPTACVSFDAAKKSLGPVAQTKSSKNAAAGSTRLPSTTVSLAIFIMFLTMI